MTSGGDSACSRNAGYRSFTARNRSSYHSQRQIRIVAALQQQLPAAERDRLVDLAEDLVEAEDVAFGRSDRPVERAEVAARNADVRVVDVAVDDVGDDPVGMLACADAVGETAKQRRRRVQVELERLGAIERARRREPLLERLATCASMRNGDRLRLVHQLVLHGELVVARRPACSRSPSRYWIFSLRYCPAELRAVRTTVVCRNPVRARTPASRARRSGRRLASARSTPERPGPERPDEGRPVIDVHSSPRSTFRRPAAA